MHQAKSPRYISSPTRILVIHPANPAVPRARNSASLVCPNALLEGVVGRRIVLQYSLQGVGDRSESCMELSDESIRLLYDRGLTCLVVGVLSNEDRQQGTGT